MTEELEKFEFGSPEWCEMVHRLVDEGLAGKDLSGITFSMCEEFTDPPAHLLKPGFTSVGFFLRVENGAYEVGDYPIDGTTFKLIGDYAAMREYALRPFDPTDMDPETVKIRQQTIDEGKMRVDGVRAEWPVAISDLDLHNEARLRTA